MSVSGSTGLRLEDRAKILLSILFVLFAFNLYILLFVEDQNFIDSIYFIVVTVSTVGFGDITPDTQLSKIAITLLIISFLISVATLSEFLVSRLIIQREDTDILFQEIRDQDHIIIFGDQEIAQRLAELWKQRFHQIYLFGENKSTLRRLKVDGITTYLPPDRPYFEELSLEMCRGVYILDKEDDEIIKYSARMRKLVPDLRIYILTKKHIQDDHTKYLPITASFKMERIVGEEISRSGRSLEFIPLVIKPGVKTQYRPVLVRAGSEPRQFFDDFVNTYCHIPISFDTEDALLIFVPSINEKAQRYSREVSNSIPLLEVFDSIFVGGYTDFTKKVLKHIGISSLDLTVVTFDPEQDELRRKHGLQGELLGPFEFEKFFANNIEKGDLFIDFYDNLTDSLYVSSVMESSDKRPFLYQIVYDEVQLDIFANISIEHMISPTLLTTRRMFNELAQDLGFAPSVISSEFHIFEHKINSKFSGLSLEKMQEQGYKIFDIIGGDGKPRSLKKNTILMQDDIVIVKTGLSS